MEIGPFHVLFSFLTRKSSSDSGGWAFPTDRRRHSTFGSDLKGGIYPAFFLSGTEQKCVTAGGAWGIYVGSDFLIVAVVVRPFKSRDAKPNNVGKRKAGEPTPPETHLVSSTSVPKTIIDAFRTQGMRLSVLHTARHVQGAPSSEIVTRGRVNVDGWTKTRSSLISISTWHHKSIGFAENNTPRSKPPTGL